MSIIKVDYGNIGGGITLEDIEYKSLTVAGNTKLNLPTTKKAKALFFDLNGAHLSYVVDGLDDNQGYSDGSRQTYYTYTFNDNSIECSASYSAGSTSFRGYIVY